MKKHYTIYQITNLINEKIYIGLHSTDNLDDGYMGSGLNIHRAFKKYGIENFYKDIIFDFDNPEDMIQKEIELVDRKFVNRKDTYNIMLGGQGWNTAGMITVKNDKGHKTSMFPEDERFVSGEYYHISQGIVTVKDKDGNTSSVDVDDPRYLSGELKHITSGLLNVKDTHGNTSMVSVDDPRYLSGELKTWSTGMVVVKDINENTFMIPIDDPRYVSGELISISTGTKHSDETKLKIGSANSIRQSGSGNSQYGKCWIYSEELKESKRVLKTEVDQYLKDNPLWKKGRKIKF